MAKKLINLNDLSGLSTFLFPDNQPHVRLEDVKQADRVSVICSMTSSLKVVQLLEVANAIWCAGAMCDELFIPYLMGARYDRIMVEGDSFDLMVFASVINLCNFKRVRLLDVHSDVALRLVDYSYNTFVDLTSPYNLEEENFVYICPDKGAKNRVPAQAEDIIYCEKQRDLATGAITLRVLNPELAAGRRCIIVDDICDGGRTFIEIAKQLPETEKLVLAVTHGIFSKGLKELYKYFDEIVTTNSLLLDADLVDGNTRLKIINIY